MCLLPLLVAIIAPDVAVACDPKQASPAFLAARKGHSYLASVLINRSRRGRAPEVAVEKGLGTPDQVGQWQPPREWPVIAIHAALLPSGKVLHYSYPGFPGSEAALWDPVTDTFGDVSMEQDIFCSGHCFLPDGTFFAAGGTVTDSSCVHAGQPFTHVFDPFLETWTRLADMTVERWYPSNVVLGDGSVLILSGLDADCEAVEVMEHYSDGTGLEVIPEGQRYLDLYPRLHLLSNGVIAHTGPEVPTYTWDHAARQWNYVTDANYSRDNGTSVLIPGEPDNVMIIGDGPSVASTERIDFSDPAPTWQLASPLTYPRGHADALLLPDRSVLVMGGGTDGQYGGPVLNPELYDPDTRKWTVLPPHVYGRMYHATTILLPDGRVLVAGQDDGQSASTAEIYEPAYLFRGARPQITSAPSDIRYGVPFLIQTPQAAAIATVALIRLTSVTHSVNMSQRYVATSFSVDGAGLLRVYAPGNPNLAPPGPYMLFILDADGVPSVAPIILLNGQGTYVFTDGFEAAG